MRPDEVVRRLEAWAKGQPVPRYSTLHIPLPDNRDILLLSFLRMGGESAPWGICFGHPEESPTILTVPEARNRDLVSDMVARFGPVLLKHFFHPGYCSQAIAGPDDPRPTRQVWLPNASHLEMLHFLAYAYSFTKWGNPERAKLLNQVGRLAGWLFRESERPGQTAVMVATDVLREAFTFPAEDVRQAHLGYLLAWLKTRGNRQARLDAAQGAERQSIATTLDPPIERDLLDGLVERWRDATRAQQSTETAVSAAQIARLLTGELRHRHDLVVETLRLLRADHRPANPGIARLEKTARGEHWFQYLRLEQRRDSDVDGPAFFPSPETDLNPRAAAARYFVQEASEALRLGALIHHDDEMQREAIESGDALAGAIVEVRDDGTGRKMIPVWRIRAKDPGSLRIREGSRLCVAGVPNRTMSVTELRRDTPGTLSVEVVITGWKRANQTPEGVRVPAATDRKLKGQNVILLPQSDAEISRTKAQRIWKDDVPGGWLTRARPSGRNAIMDPEVQEQGPARTPRVAPS
jgi:hypothetical protein